MHDALVLKIESDFFSLSLSLSLYSFSIRSDETCPACPV